MSNDGVKRWFGWQITGVQYFENDIDQTEFVEASDHDRIVSEFKDRAERLGKELGLAIAQAAKQQRVIEKLRQQRNAFVWAHNDFAMKDIADLDAEIEAIEKGDKSTK